MILKDEQTRIIIWNRIIKKLQYGNTFYNETWCWDWTGVTNGKKAGGYGKIFYLGQQIRVHRLFYEFYKGPIPEGLVIDHLCRNRLCCNPEHLEAVTNKQNVMRGFGITVQSKFKTHCKKGHPYEGNNLYQYKNMRHCRICKTEASLKSQRKKRGVLL